MKKFFILHFTIIFFIFPHSAYAHPGRTDSSGCHTCRTNCTSWGLSTGEYHCHNAKQPYQPKEPIKSHYGDSGTGYTTPAPEYKYSESSVSKNEKSTSDSDNENSNTWIYVLIGGAGIWLYSKFKK